MKGGLVKRRLVAMAVGAVVALAPVTPAFAPPPGPGDKQCTPGQNSQPQPGKKGGTCPGNKHKP
jgi:hypothetical protein